MKFEVTFVSTEEAMDILGVTHHGGSQQARWIRGGVRTIGGRDVTGHGRSRLWHLGDLEKYRDKVLREEAKAKMSQPPLLQFAEAPAETKKAGPHPAAIPGGENNGGRLAHNQRILLESLNKVWDWVDRAEVRFTSLEDAVTDPKRKGAGEVG